MALNRGTTFPELVNLLGQTQISGQHFQGISWFISKDIANTLEKEQHIGKGI